jgi:hypothetical protein
MNDDPGTLIPSALVKEINSYKFISGIIGHIDHRLSR